MQLREWNARLHGLVVFRALLGDPVVAKLAARTDRLEAADDTIAPLCDAVAAFEAALFAHTTNLGDYLSNAVLETETVCVRQAAAGQLSPVMEAALNSELNFLQKLCGLKKPPVFTPIVDDYYKGEIYDEAIRRWISENILKIKSLPTETLGNMRQIILDSYLKGKSIRDIQKDIQEEYNVSKRYAQLLARDQIATLNAQITKLQQQDAGCRKYKWSTSHDSRVRDCHRSLNGKTFSWDDPPEMWYETKSGRVYTGRHCHPGEDYCCRCVAIPVFDLDTVNVPMKQTTGSER